MKQLHKAALLGILILLTASIILPPTIPRTTAAVPYPVVQYTGEQYKVISGLAFSSTRQMERELNRLAIEGWKVRTSVGASLILAR